MGMYSTLARLDGQRRLQLSEDAIGVVTAAEKAVYAPAPSSWVLDLGKEGYAVETILQVYLPKISEDAVTGAVTGIEVGVDVGYGQPRYLLPERVGAIAQLLEDLPNQPLPAADATGYTPDARLSSDSQLKAVHDNLTRIGVDFRYEADVATLKQAITAFCNFYQQARADQQGLLLFIR